MATGKRMISGAPVYWIYTCALSSDVIELLKLTCHLTIVLSLFVCLVTPPRRLGLKGLKFSV